MSSVVANKRMSESKYVSVFADSRPDVDITFKDALLSRPSNHFVVGVDNFGISLGSLPMCDPADQDDPGFYIIRLGRQRRPDAAVLYFDDTLESPGDDVAIATSITASTVAQLSVFTIQTAELVDLRIPFQNVQQFLRGLQEWAAYVNTIFTAALTNLEYYVGYAVKAEDEAEHPNLEHFAVRLGTDGRLRLIGTKAFWANFFISIQKPKYQYALEGKKTRDNKPM